MAVLLPLLLLLLICACRTVHQLWNADRILLCLLLMLLPQ
jgi:hypothetical protein